MKIRSEKHRRFIAEQPCMITGINNNEIAPHHLLRVQGKGMATKSCDSWVVPLYHVLHDALHSCGNEEVFFANNGWDYEMVKKHATDLALRSPDKKIREVALKRIL